ncbi:MAG: pyruvate kinase [Bacteroidia bacterium]|nr:MAG: pyruvate kinase [Bacteroidia bacterium]
MQKQTKIVGTISNLRLDRDFLSGLIRAGVNVLRLNTAHQSPQELAEAVDTIRAVDDRVAILVDTKGPEIRVSSGGEPVEATVGRPIHLKGDPEGLSGGDRLYVNLPGFGARVPLGASILIDDGELELVVTAKDGETLTCFPQSDGLIKLRKSVNIPSVPFDLPSVSERDREFIRVASEKGVEFIAHSFVRCAEDVLAVRRLVEQHGGVARVIAKIENQEGVDHIDRILDHAYGVMVARGDLGIEIPEERVPAVQRMILQKCIESSKPVIVATQMLHTMIENPRPTRAEISDVAGAIYGETDAVMLSGETAYGKYPEEAVGTMTRIASEVERHLRPFRDHKLQRVDYVVTETLARSTVGASVHIKPRAIIVDTLTGRTARYVAAYRGRVPIFAMCYRRSVARQLQLTYGVQPYFMEMRSSREEFLQYAVSLLLDEGQLQHRDMVMVIGGSFGPSEGATFLEISQVSKILSSRVRHER